MRESRIAPPGITCKCSNVMPIFVHGETPWGWQFRCSACNRMTEIERLIVNYALALEQFRGSR